MNMRPWTFVGEEMESPSIYDHDRGHLRKIARWSDRSPAGFDASSALQYALCVRVGQRRTGARDTIRVWLKLGLCSSMGVLASLELEAAGRCACTAMLRRSLFGRVSLSGDNACCVVRPKGQRSNQGIGL